MIDIAIIGGGPAGLSAAITALQRNKTVAVYAKGMKTSWLYKAKEVNNYLGFYQVSGSQLLQAYLDHANKLGVAIEEKRVDQILPMGEYFTMNVSNNFVEAKSIIIATGMAVAKTIKGESEFLGKGVSYCATCDGMLYRDKEVVVVGDNEEGEEDANFLAEICKKVYYASTYDTHTKLRGDVETIKGKPIMVKGNDVVEALAFKEKEIPCDGAFFIKETTPIDSILPGLALQNQVIQVDRNMATNIPGVFAAGDCTGKPLQVSKAVGEGLVAALSAVSYVS